MRIVVTGSNGLVGSRLAAALAERGHQVTGLARGPRRHPGAYAYCELDLTAASALEAVVEGLRPDVIINPASMTEVDACEKDPALAYAANAALPASLGKLARRLEAHLLHVSTDYVFDGDAGPYDEAAIPNPRGVYALTKHIGEQAVRALAPSWAIARTAVVFGWPPAGRPNFGAWLLGALSQKQQVKLFEDQLVSPSLADSVAAQLAELAERRLPGIWNTCGAEVLDRMSFGRALCEVFGFDRGLLVPTRLEAMKLASPRPLRSGLRVEKARAQLEAKPLSINEALARFHASYLAQGGTP